MLGNIRERYLYARLKSDEHKARWIIFIEGLFLVILLINAIVINFYFIRNLTKDQQTIAQEPEKITETIPDPTLITPTFITPENTTIAKTTPSSQTNTQIVNSNQIKEFFIPIGTGSSTAGNWTDVPGARADLDFGKYQYIKEVRFEASVDVPTANQWVAVRLYNLSDDRPVWNSEVLSNGEKNTYLVSPSIIHEPGFKTYQVQMKTQLQFPAELTMSRLHIILD